MVYRSLIRWSSLAQSMFFSIAQPDPRCCFAGAMGDHQSQPSRLRPSGFATSTAQRGSSDAAAAGKGFLRAQSKLDPTLSRAFEPDLSQGHWCLNIFFHPPSGGSKARRASLGWGRRRQFNGRSSHGPLPLSSGQAKGVVVWFFFVILTGTLMSLATPAEAQNLLSSEPTGTQYPSQEYYLGLQAYRAGDLNTASELFDAALRNARRDVHGRWVDSIPSLAMLAECHWQLGSLPTAREHLDHVFQIAMRSRGWLNRVDWSKLTNSGFQTTQPNLWPETKAVRVLPVTRRIMYLSGEQLTEERLARGGVIEEPSIRSIDAVEILRGLAIASYRRRIILGPLCEHDPLGAGLLESTKYPANLNDATAHTLIGCVRAGGHFAAGDDDRTISNATNSANVSGSAHPLTAVTMLTHGSAPAGTAKADQAVAGLIQTIHAAGALEQPEWAGESMQLAASCADSQNAGVLVNLAKSIGVVLNRESRLAALHCWIAGADAAVTAGDLTAASEMLGNAQSIASRRDVVLPRMEAYAAYVAARIAASSGSSIGVVDKTAVDQALARVNEFARNNQYRNQPLVSMPRIYQLGLVRQTIGNSQGIRTGEQLLADYCRDSPIDAWRRDPVDALSGVIADRSVLHAARVNLAATQRYGDKLLIASDALLADRFNSQLPLGGRLTQIRFLSRVDDAALDPEAVLMRDQAGAPLKELRVAVSAMNRPDRQQIASLESQATRIGLDRAELPLVTPPPLKPKRPTAGLPPRTGLLTFVQIGSKMHASLAVEGKITMWTIPGSGRVHSEVGQLLRGIGVGKTRGTRLTEDQAWRTAAGTLRRHLIPKDQSFATLEIDHLIVVPDGPLWYVPFELLPLTEEDDGESIGDRISISYAPTPGFALHALTSQNSSRAIGIASGPLFAPKDAEQNKLVVQSIMDAIQDPVNLSATTTEPSGLFGPSIGHFVVAAPRNATTGNLLTTMQLSPQDNRSAYGTLAGWIQYPAIVPRSVVLVGLRTPVERWKNGYRVRTFSNHVRTENSRSRKRVGQSVGCWRRIYRGVAPRISTRIAVRQHEQCVGASKNGASPHRT